LANIARLRIFPMKSIRALAAANAFSDGPIVSIAYILRRE
jgi:hypothetical protein